MKNSVFSFLLILSTPLAYADDWTKGEAIRKFGGIVDKDSATLALRKTERDGIQAWLKQVNDQNLDLAEHAFLKGIALHITQKFDEATKELLDYLQAHGDFPTKEWDRYLGKIFVNTAHKAVANKDYAMLDATIPLACRFFAGNPLIGYQGLAIRLMTEKNQDNFRVLNRMLVLALEDDRLDEGQKQNLLTRLYGRRTQPQRRSTAGRVKSPRPIKPFKTQDIDGKPIALNDYKGKVVLVDFWATWCGPCLMDMPNLVSVYKKYADKGFDIVGISLDRGAQEAKLRKTLERFGAPWRQIFDGKGWGSTIAQANGVRSIPMTFLLDRSGKVRYTHLRGPSLEEKVAELIAEAKPGT